MPKGYLAYYSDFVLGASGVPVSGATVAIYSTSSFANGTLPTGSSVGASAVATASTDATGRFSFPALPPDDYHILVTYTPPGGTQVVSWRYHVPVLAYDALRRVQAAERSGALARTLARLSAGLNVTIFCAGDDVTVGYNATGATMGGWPALLAAQIAVLYPQSAIARQDPNGFAATLDAPIPGWTPVAVQAGTNGQTITVVNGGVKGDTVLRFLRRFANLSTSWPAADLVIASFGLWESTAGQAQQFASAADLASHLEALVNVVRTYSQAEVLLCTPAIPGTGTEDYANAVRQVSARTRSDLADIRQLFLDRYAQGGANGGYDPWLNTSASGVLPTDAGHAAIAGEIARHLQPAIAVPFDGGPYGAAKSWELVRVPYSSPQIAIADTGWSTHTGYQGAALSSVAGSEKVTSNPGDSITIAGRFVDLHMLCRRFSDCGQVSVAVDGGTPITIDLFRQNPASTSDLTAADGAMAPQDRVTLAHGLADTTHTVAIALLAGKNPLSAGTFWRFESLELGRWRRHGYEVETSEPQNRIQRGTAYFPFVAQSSVGLAINFPVACTANGVLPSVVATMQDPAYYCTVTNVTQVGFNLSAYRRDGTNVTANPNVSWIALG